jgi:hypothetical protein
LSETADETQCRDARTRHTGEAQQRNCYSAAGFEAARRGGASASFAAERAGVLRPMLS